MSFRFDLNLAADFAKRIGDPDLAAKYQSVSDEV